MTLKILSAQISVFLADGVMNPSMLTEEINKSFNKLFAKENYSLKLDEAPNDMPLVRYSSIDGKYAYDFAKKRINFYINFSDTDSVDTFEEYKNQVKEMIFNLLLIHSSVSRVGIAINYYIDKKDEKYSYWVDKYKFPFYDSNETSEIVYTINNNFIHKGLKFNKILILSTGKISSTKNVPIVSVDVNNLNTAKINDDNLRFIFEELNVYKKDLIEVQLSE